MNKYTDLRLVHCADGSAAYTSNSTLDHLIAHINCELSKISDWLCPNRLSLNVAKSSYSIYSDKIVNALPDIHIRGQALHQSNEINFLGVIIDDKLSFGNHIDSVCKTRP